MVTNGQRAQRERLRQKLSRTALAAKTGLSAKTIQRVEEGERDQYLFLVEEALGLPPSGNAGSAEDEDRILRAVSDEKFWLEATRRAAEQAQRDSSPNVTQPGRAQPRRGRRGEVPTHLIPGETATRVQDEQPG